MLMEIFRILDLDSNGVISTAELFTVYRNANGKDSESLKYFEAMDMNSDGVITMDEYITFWEQCR